MAGVFISYNRHDQQYAHKLRTACEQRSIPVWMDVRIEPGEQWASKIEEQVDGCDAMVLIMTPEARHSTYVNNELLRAIRLNKRIFPLLLRGAGPWLDVESFQYEDVRSGKLPGDRFFEALRQALKPEADNPSASSTQPSTVATRSQGEPLFNAWSAPTLGPARAHNAQEQADRRAFAPSVPLDITSPFAPAASAVKDALLRIMPAQYTRGILGLPQWDPVEELCVGDVRARFSILQLPKKSVRRRLVLPGLPTTQDESQLGKATVWFWGDIVAPTTAVRPLSEAQRSKLRELGWTAPDNGSPPVIKSWPVADFASSAAYRETRARMADETQFDAVSQTPLATIASDILAAYEVVHGSTAFAFAVRVGPSVASAP